MTQKSHYGHIPQENHNRKRYTYTHVHCSTIYNSQDIEATQMSINRGMDEEDVIHVYNGILLSHKKATKLGHLLKHGWTKKSII